MTLVEKILLPIMVVLLVCPLLEGQTAGREPGPGTVTAGGTTFIDAANPVTAKGELRFWRAHSTLGARVILKVFRPEGSRLVLVGTSPLETLEEGETATFACHIPVLRNDLIGCYCPDTYCVDRFADGLTWTLSGDAGTVATTEPDEEIGTPALLAATTRSFDVPSHAATDLVVPVVGRGPGLAGSTWTTSLEIFSTSGSEQLVALSFNRSGRDNTWPAASTQVMLPARGTVTFQDLLLDAFQLAQATGSLSIVATQPVIAHARIVNTSGSCGSFGQVVPALPVAWSLGDDDVAGVNSNADIFYLFEIREDDDHRTNIGVTNTSGVTLKVILRAFSGTSVLGSPLELELLPYSHTQVSKVLEKMGVPAGSTGVRVNVSAAAGSQGRFVTYASRIDNHSGDATLVLGARESP